MSDDKQTVIDIFSGQTNYLKSLIDYQKGSVESKTIIGKKTGNVTLCAFDKRQGLSEHIAP